MFFDLVPMNNNRLFGRICMYALLCAFIGVSYCLRSEMHLVYDGN